MKQLLGGVFFLWPPNWGPVGPMNGEIVGQKIKIKKIENYTGVTVRREAGEES